MRGQIVGSRTTITTHVRRESSEHTTKIPPAFNSENQKHRHWLWTIQRRVRNLKYQKIAYAKATARLAVTFTLDFVESLDEQDFEMAGGGRRYSCHCTGIGRCRSSAWTSRWRFIRPP